MQLSPTLRIGLRSALLLLLLPACTDPAPSQPDAEVREAEQSVVYGVDDRLDYYQVGDVAVQGLMRDSIVALVRPWALDVSNPNDIAPIGSTLGASRGLCSDERFRDQPTSGNCSGTLIDDDLVLTAGHCVDDLSDCNNYYFVFDYYYAAAGVLETISSPDVYTCRSIAARQNSGGLDYAIVQLDRSVTGRAPATVRPGDDAMRVGDDLVVVGFGSGLPAKADQGGEVTSTRASVRDYFQANVDTFGGNSGSGVFDSSLRVAGILVRGQTDYVFDGSSGCNRVNVLSDDANDTEDITYVARAIEDLCSRGWPSARLCGGAACGDGSVDEGETCDDGNLVDGDGCAFDCQLEECGDGRLQEGETCDDGNTTSGDGCSATCVDEATCGNGALEPGEGCDDGNIEPFDGCGATCQPETCPDASGSALGVDVFVGNTCAVADRDAPASCGDGTFGGELSFAFTAPADDLYIFDTSRSARVNYDTVLYARAACGGAELACNDDIARGVLDSEIRVALNAGESILVFASGYEGECGEVGVSVRVPVCGDGVVEGDELCDDGNTDGGDLCPADCGDGASCGNGVIEEGETCDDGDTTSGDGCSALCQLESCPDGVLGLDEVVIAETCGNDVDEPASCGEANSGGERAFVFVAPNTASYVFDTATEATDYDTALYVRESCGGAELACNDDIERGEILESRVELALNAGQSVVVHVSGYESECGTVGLRAREVVCGDGIVAPSEACDDGDGDDTNACTNACELPACGDGIVSVEEECDDANDVGGDGCSLSCEREFCGDGIVQPLLGESCDDGNADPSDGCDACTLTSICGDGATDDGEECDDGNNEDFDGCSSVCRVESCLSGALIEGDGAGVFNTDTCASGDIDPPASCGGSNSGGDAAFLFRATQTGTYRVTTDSAGTTYDTALYVRDACGGNELDCNDDIDTDARNFRSELFLDVRAGDEVLVFVSGYNANCGEVEVDVFFAGCGDGSVSLGEECDDGNTDDGDGCSATCQVEFCGDGLVQPEIGEACDDGNTDDEDGCSASCAVEACGDGVVQSALGERCDDGNTSDEDGCSGVCLLEFCGDGIRQRSLGEACDDGNSESGDGCSATCRIEACGDGIVQAGLGETCDDGNLANADGCSSSCEIERCGDGVTQVPAGEACDDGNTQDGDGCSATCAVEFCGDGVVQASLGESCDEGAANALEADACRPDCQLPACGDRIVDTGESCDDGDANRFAPNACRPTCQLPTCGDGLVDIGEDCDDGDDNADEADACRLDCALPACGDGIVDTDEACDDGDENGDLADTCRSTCALPTCGDGIVDMGEGCDDGVGNDDEAADACRTTCALATCGDGVVDAGEACDEGRENADAADACRTTCVAPACGDGIVDNGEACDEGSANADVADACRTTCALPLCGDGIVDADEACDDGPDNADVPGACGTDCTLQPVGADAGQSDAGQSDVGQSDVGQSDVGQSDAGQSDPDAEADADSSGPIPDGGPNRDSGDDGVDAIDDDESGGASSGCAAAGQRVPTWPALLLLALSWRRRRS